MNDSKLVKHKFTANLNQYELAYRNSIQPKETGFDNPEKWIERTSDGRRNFLPVLNHLLNFQGQILELGAGMCWFSAEISRIETVEKVYALDLSEYILENIAPYVIRHFQADSQKIVRVVGDFHNLEFEEEMFDYVIFDASLHHIDEQQFQQVMKEVYRVLKDDGKVVAIREPFLYPLPGFKSLGRCLFGLREKKMGVIENIYTLSEWRSKFEQANFISLFTPYEPKLNHSGLSRLAIHQLLKALKSLFFPSYIITLQKNTRTIKHS